MPMPIVSVEAYLCTAFPRGKYPGGINQIIRDRAFKPRRRSEFVGLELPLDWAQTENPDRNFRMQIQGWTMLHPVMTAFDALEDKSAATEYFLEVLRDWWANFAESPEDIVTSRTPSDYTWYDMSVGYRALALSFFTSRIVAYDLPVSSEDLETLLLAVDKHRRHLRRDEVIYPNNHGIFQVHGLRALAEASDDEESDADADHAIAWMEKLLGSQFDDRGFHLEHSPQYHKFVLDKFIAVESSGWYQESRDFTARLKRARDALPWLLDSRGSPPAVGDSLPSPLKDVVLPGPSEGGPILASDFASSGYAVIRSNWGVASEEETFFFVTGGYHSKSHKHRDCLSFEWSEGGTKLIADSGKYGYWADATRRYMLSSRAHNSLEIEDFNVLKMAPYGSALQDPVYVGEGVWRIDGELDFPAVRHRRSLYLSPRKWLVLQDHASSARERDFTQWLHLGKEFENSPETSNGRLRFTDSKGHVLIVSQLSAGLDMRLARGESPGTDEMQGFLSERDDEVIEGFALGFHAPRVRGFYGLAVLALDEDSLAVAEAFARSLDIDREFTVSSKPTRAPLRRAGLIDEPVVASVVDSGKSHGSRSWRRWLSKHR